MAAQTADSREQSGEFIADQESPGIKLMKRMFHRDLGH